MSQSKRKKLGLYDEIMQLSEQQHYSPSSSSTQSSTPYSIFRVPGTLRILKPRAYNPRVVSIGLIHANQLRLQPMKEHKESYMHSLFHRTATNEEYHENVGETCFNAMLSEAHRASICYPPSVRSSVRANTIPRTMLLDGCFLLEFLIRSLIIKQNKKKRELSAPIFCNNLKVRDVVHDLLLLENQIPLFVLERLFGLTVRWFQNQSDSFSLTDLILEFSAT